MSLLSLTHDLCTDLEPLTFGDPVSHVYNPLVYARACHEAWLQRFGQGTREVILVGMNPGPWGMAQTGVPFGDPAMVRDWLGIRAPVAPPARPHPKVPVRGVDSPRSEGSGRRLWGWARDRWTSPERFMARYFVVNWCPLCFLEEGGRNRTPDHLPASERALLEPLCDAALRAIVLQMEPRWVIGVGTYAEARARVALADLDVRVARILHPSPASPLANKGWVPEVERTLRGLGLEPGQ